MAIKNKILSLAIIGLLCLSILTIFQVNAQEPPQKVFGNTITPQVPTVTFQDRANSFFFNVSTFSVEFFKGTRKIEKAKKWILKYVKFNLLSIAAFSISTLIYFLILNNIGSTWAWFIAQVCGGVTTFFLISYFNKKKKGVIFEQ